VDRQRIFHNFNKPLICYSIKCEFEISNVFKYMNELIDILNIWNHKIIFFTGRTVTLVMIIKMLKFYRLINLFLIIWKIKSKGTTIQQHINDKLKNLFPETLDMIKIVFCPSSLLSYLFVYNWMLVDYLILILNIQWYIKRVR